MFKWVLANLKHKPGLVKDETLRELHSPQAVIPDSPDFAWHGTADITHPGYGDFTVSVEGDKLSARYNGLPLRMTPHHYEIFLIEDEDEELTLRRPFYLPPRTGGGRN